jgi:hypothetical protein
MYALQRSPYLTANTYLRYELQALNAVYRENHTEHTETLYGQNAEFNTVTWKSDYRRLTTFD